MCKLSIVVVAVLVALAAADKPKAFGSKDAECKNPIESEEVRKCASKCNTEVMSTTTGQRYRETCANDETDESGLNKKSEKECHCEFTDKKSYADMTKDEKCMVKCMVDKFHVINADGKTVNDTNLLKSYTIMVKDNSPAFDKIKLGTSECYNTADKTKEPMEQLYDIGMCAGPKVKEACGACKKQN